METHVPVQSLTAGSNACLVGSFLLLVKVEVEHWKSFHHSRENFMEKGKAADTGVLAGSISLAIVPVCLR